MIYPSKNIKLSDKPYSKNTPFEVRMVREELANKKVEISISSLLVPKEYPSNLLKKLYAKRWGIETLYDELKIEHFSGYSNQKIQQDFYAALFISNVQKLIASKLEHEIN